MNAATGNAMANLKTKNRPSMILVLLPQSAAEIRARVKFWGDVTTGSYILLTFALLCQ